MITLIGLVGIIILLCATSNSYEKIRIERDMYKQLFEAATLRNEEQEEQVAYLREAVWELEVLGVQCEEE